MTDSRFERDPVEVLADEFASRSRRGESPSVSEYIATYPEDSAQIEELFPVVAMLEQLRIEEMAKHEATVRRAKDVKPNRTHWHSRHHSGGNTFAQVVYSGYIL